MKQITREALNKTVWTTDRLGRLVKTTYKEWLDDNHGMMVNTPGGLAPILEIREEWTARETTYKMWRHGYNGTAGHWTGFETQDQELAELEKYTYFQKWAEENEEAAPIFQIPGLVIRQADPAGYYYQWYLGDKPLGECWGNDQQYAANMAAQLERILADNGDI